MLASSVFLLISCSGSSFSGGDRVGKPAKKDGSDADRDGDDTVDDVILPGPQDGPATTADQDGNLSIIFDPIKFDEAEGSKFRRPFTLYFAFDVTKSMETPLTTVKDNIATFANAVKAEGFDLNLGAVTFRDSVVDTFAATSDVNAFKNFVASQIADAGDDNTEAGIAAMMKNLQSIKSRVSAAKKDEILAMLTITDNASHDGTGENAKSRNCSIEKLVSEFNKDPNIHPQLKFYYSVPSSYWPFDGCSYTDARVQYAEILDRILPTIPKARRGAALGWPFSSEVFLNTFMKEIEAIKAGEALVCLPREATLSSGGTTIATWTPSSYKEMYDAYQNKTKVTWKNAIPSSKAEELKGTEIDLTLHSCCQQKAKARDGSFASCYKDITEETTFEVK
jgi:hypothetical protein